ncbi:hypothetical protein J7384_17040 [Endozoicomonas sp. G2_1]|uniref:hypothetical protein n=1 Tax=Endozoicomonas sp. G2_1 TaxID=2821091 RepID=UPI001AD9793B|nr:hypothetical protein [Endozoicomonas sp. G2_1]MBO9492070.1 hypothetical protein [Endozoicomonas sp. G2_1]
MKYYYGALDREHIVSCIGAVCSTLGGSRRLAKKLLFETCAAETQLCTYPDRHPDRLGVGGYQFDQIALDDIKKETDSRHKERVKSVWGYDLARVQLADLADDFMLATILCRLKYMRVPAAIPDNYLERAVYWKKHYNTEAGKGTVEHYLNSAEKWLYAGGD